MSLLRGVAAVAWLVVLHSYQRAVNGSMFPPAIASITGNGEVDSNFYLFLETEIFTFTCQADRPDENTTIQWRKVDAPSLPVAWKYSRQGGNASITLLRTVATREFLVYDGSYECIVSNSVGTAVSTPIVLKVAEIHATNLAVHAKVTDALMVKARRGSTVALTCNSSGEMTFSPDRASLSLIFHWSSINMTMDMNPLARSSTYLNPNDDTRFTGDEYGTLYIRNVTESDSRLWPRTYVCSIEGLSLPQKRVGIYTLEVSDSEDHPTETKLIRRSPDVTARLGSTIYLSCVFESPDSAKGEVLWNKPFTKSYEKGSLIEIANVSTAHEGAWNCTFDEISATINVKVLRSLLISGIVDTYASLNEDVRLDCLSSETAAFKWYSNIEAIERTPRYELQSTPASSSLIIRKVAKADEGVIRCTTTSYQNVTVSRNVRLIVMDKAKVDAVKTVQVSSGDENSGGDAGTYVVTDQTTQMLFTCSYSRDSRATEVRVTWQLEKQGGVIDEQTHEPEFGLQRPAVTTNTSKRESTLAVNYVPGMSGSIFGRVHCTLVYKLLDKTFSVQSEKAGQILATPGLTIPIISRQWRFPYWIIGAVLASVTLIAIVTGLIVRHLQRNRGEHYHVEKRERKAGYDRPDVKASWEDFNRPDVDPAPQSSSLAAIGEDVGAEASIAWTQSV